MWYEQVMRASHGAVDGVDGMVNHPVTPMDWRPLDSDCHVAS